MEQHRNFRARRALAFCFAGFVILIGAMVVSVMTGAATIPYDTIKDAFFNFDAADSKHLLVVKMRVPRAIIGALVGAALAVSGAIMQGITRNPLADSGLLGLSAGASFALALAFGFFKDLSYSAVVAMTFLGAGAGAAIVFGISSSVKGGARQIKLVLSGACVSALLTAMSQGIALTKGVSQNITFWTMGSISGANWEKVMISAPLILAALAVGRALSKQITMVSMGDEVALGLGVKLGRVKAVGIFIVVLLAGTSVAMAGMIAFVGMIVPHFCRLVVGPNYRWIIPSSAVAGAVLLVVGDIGAKTINPPSELPVGAILSLIGAPVFLYLARQKRGAL